MQQTLNSTTYRGQHKGQIGADGAWKHKLIYFWWRVLEGVLVFHLKVLSCSKLLSYTCFETKRSWAILTDFLWIPFISLFCKWFHMIPVQIYVKIFMFWWQDVPFFRLLKMCLYYNKNLIVAKQRQKVKWIKFPPKITK